MGLFRPKNTDLESEDIYTSDYIKDNLLIASGDRDTLLQLYEQYNKDNGILTMDDVAPNPYGNGGGGGRNNNDSGESGQNSIVMPEANITPSDHPVTPTVPDVIIDVPNTPNTQSGNGEENEYNWGDGNGSTPNKGNESKSKWLLYAAIGIAVYSIIKK